MAIDPVSIVQWLTAAGPYAVTLIMGIWLTLERAERLAAQADATACRDRLMSDRTEQAAALAELGEATRNRIREHDERLDRVLDLCDARRRRT
jgi:hypothetical protein